MIFIVFLVIVIILLINTKLTFKNETNTEIVIARYNEDLAWLNKTPFNKYPAIVYNKGLNDNFIKNKNIEKVVNLPNVGKIDHTILYHIINNYDSLKNITIFLPGSTNIPIKLKKAKQIIANLEKINNSVYICDRKLNYKDMYDFTLDEWKTSYSENQNKETDENMLKSTIRPFGKWYEHFFEGKNMTCISYMGIFAMSKKDILKNPKEYYINLIKEVESHPNPEAGHYIERSWEAIFYPLDPESKILN